VEAEKMNCCDIEKPLLFVTVKGSREFGRSEITAKMERVE
jgi:hypothetical protein